MPTADDFNYNSDPNAVLTPNGPRFWVKCKGPYALCAFANCTILPGTNPPLAECGCFHPKKKDLSNVTPRQLKTKQVFDATAKACYRDGDAINKRNVRCRKVNSAPACKAINENSIYNGVWELISTFTKTHDQQPTHCTGPGLMAECMSGPCYNTTAWDGSPIKCYCLVTNVPQGQGYVLGSHKGHGISCTQPAGYIISGELNKGFWNPTATRD